MNWERLSRSSACVIRESFQGRFEVRMYSFIMVYETSKHHQCCRGHLDSVAISVAMTSSALSMHASGPAGHEEDDSKLGRSDLASIELIVWSLCRCTLAWTMGPKHMMSRQLAAFLVDRKDQKPGQLLR